MILKPWEASHGAKQTRTLPGGGSRTDRCPSAYGAGSCPQSRKGSTLQSVPNPRVASTTIIRDYFPPSGSLTLSEIAGLTAQ
jgi:hypothetical protein